MKVIRKYPFSKWSQKLIDLQKNNVEYLFLKFILVQLTFVTSKIKLLHVSLKGKQIIEFVLNLLTPLVHWYLEKDCF